MIQEQGHVGLEARCAGVKAKVPGTEILYVDGKDMTSVQSTATAKLQASKDADVIIGLGAPITLTLSNRSLSRQLCQGCKFRPQRG